MALTREKRKLLKRAATFGAVLTTICLLSLGHVAIQHNHEASKTVLVDSWGFFQDGDHLDAEGGAHWDRTIARRKAEPTPVESSCKSK
jgi:hypothetical protein